MTAILSLQTKQTGSLHQIVPQRNNSVPISLENLYL